MAVAYTLEFEKPLQELDRQIEDLRKLSEERGIDVAEEVRLLETRLVTLR
jgi:acetyl-CoA carboxylase carboxyl transferase subunit alpha